MKKLFTFSAPALLVCLLLSALHLEAQSIIRYNAGGPQFISAAGDTFVPDLNYTMGATSTFTNNNIVDVAGTTDDQLFRTERSANVNGGSFSYNITAANGTYDVKLYFAEIFFGATGGNTTPPFTGKRVFDVTIEGTLVLNDYDINADVGPMTAVVKDFNNVTVSDGQLNITFGGVTNKPKVSALVITPISVVPPTNTPPTFNVSGNVTVNEDFAGTQTVTVTPDPVPPAESGQTVTYSLSPSISFANASINTATGTVSITKVTNGNGSQLMTITANDGQASNNIATKTFTLTVNAVNDPPSFTTSGNINVNENFAGTQTVTVTPAAVPADETGQTVTYSLSPTPASITFANIGFNTTNGQVSITSVSNANGFQQFTITANDGQAANNLATQNFTLTVNDTSTTPSAQGSLHYNAGGAQYVSVANDTFIVEPAGILSGTTTTYTNPTANLPIANTTDDVLYRTERSTNVNGGSFGYNIPVPNGLYTVKLYFAEIFFGATGGNNTAPFAGKRVFDVSIEGNLVLDNYDIYADVGAQAAVIKQYDSVSVADANLDIDFASVTNKAKISAISIIPISIAPPDTTNTPPTFNVSGNVTVNEDFAGTQTVTVTPNPVPPAEAGQTVTYSLSPPSVAFANVSINASTGLVSITKVTNANGSQIFTITANDGQASNNLATKNFTLTVNAVNDAPAFTASGNIVVNENFAGSQTVTVTPATVPADETSQTVTYSLSPPTVAFANVSINATSGLVTITAVSNGHGSQIFTITANDGQASNNTATQNFTLTVNDTITAPQKPIFYNAGGPQYVSVANDTFVPDLFYSSGTTVSSNNVVADIAGTTDDVLYRTERFKSDFTYTIPVQNGTYTISLYFAEIFYGVAGGNTTPPFTGKRIFHVVLEGDTVLKNYDINVDVGPGTAVIKQFSKTVSDGNITINLHGVVNNAKISAISIIPAGAPNNPPTVSITAPLGGSFIENTPIQIDANASDPGGSISKVEFYQNGNLLNADLNAPYSFTWSNATPGTKSLTAKAYDNLNASTTSSPVNITVTADAAPSVSISSPANGANFIAGANVPINATASDDVAVTNVEFYEGANLLGSDNSFPYSFTYNNATLGDHSLTAKAFDGAGHSTTSAGITIHVVADPPPTVSISSPANGASFTVGQTITINATANDNLGVTQVDFYAGLTFLGTDNTFPYSFDWTNATAGNYNLTAVAFDATPSGTTSATVNITVNPPGSSQALLVVGNTVLNNGDQAVKTRLETLGFNVTVVSASASVTADANGKNLVLISSTVTAANVGNKFTNVPVPVINWEQGLHDDFGMTSSASGNEGTSATQTQINIIGAGHPLAGGLANGLTTIYAPAQTATWGKPSAGAVLIATTSGSATQIAIFGYESGAAMVTGNAPARRVGLFLQDAGAAFLTASGTALLDAAITWAANSAPPVNNPPTVSISNPANNATFTALANITIDATANDPDAGGSISKVEFYQNGNLLNTDTQFPYSFGWTNVPAGSYQLTAKAFDNLNASTTSIIVNVTVNPAANNPPTVSITNPANNATFTALANITIDATANDPDASGSISKVEFYQGATLLNTDITFPYSFNWTNVPAGSYQLTAKAFDNLNASTTSTIVNVTVNPAANNPPTVSITNPANNATFTALSNITIDATANDPDAGGSISKVEFYQNGNLLNTDVSFPYSFGWTNVPQGSYQLTAKAFDNLNAQTTSTIVNVSVNPPASGGTILFIVGNLTLNNGDQAVKTRLETLGYTVVVKLASASVTADATGKSAVVISSTINSADVATKFTNVTVPVMDWEQGLLDDLQMVSASSGNAGSINSQTQLNITGAGHPLAAGLSNGLTAVYSSPQTVSWGKPSVNAAMIATASGNATNIAIFGYEVGATMVGLTAPARRVGFFLQDAGAAFLSANGIALFDAAITWLAGAPPANNPPTVSITNPANNATFTALASITIDATANDPDAGGSISKVEFYQGASLLNTDVSFPYSFNWTNVPAGSYQLTAKAYDNLNASTTSAIVNVTVNPAANNPPTVSITNPANNATFTALANITIDATANDPDAGGSISKVEFYQGANLLGFDNSAPYSLNWNSVPQGSYQLTAKAFDNLNASTTSAIVNITVNPAGNQPPTVSITSPSNGATFTAPANVAISASATDPDAGGSISKVEFYVGATLLGTDMTFPYSLNWNGVGAGTYQLSAKAFDNLNLSTTSSTVTFTVNPAGNTPPTVSITNPANNATFTALANITIDATASDPGGSVSNVEFYQGANLLGSDNSAPYSFNWTNVPAGSYQLTAKAFDNLNATTTSAIINVTVNPPSGLTALFVVGNTTLNTGDAAVKTKLQNLGYTVTVVSGSASVTADATGKSLVLISSTIVAGDVNTKFTNVAVPVINWESGIMDDLKLTGTPSTEYGTVFNQTQISIIGAGHPLAASLPNGTTTVVNSQQTITWGKPNGNAVAIATIVGAPTQICIFGYPAGAAMVGINAPARRVGFMLSDGSPASLNTAGMQLLEAAILWATGTTKNDELETGNAMETASLDVNIYPNPSAGAFNIKFENAQEGKLSVAIYNQMGQAIYQHEKLIDAGVYQENFDLGTLPSGLYLIQMTNGGSSLTRRLLISSR